MNNLFYLSSPMGREDEAGGMKQASKQMDNTKLVPHYGQSQHGG